MPVGWTPGGETMCEESVLSQMGFMQTVGLKADKAKHKHGVSGLLTAHLWAGYVNDTGADLRVNVMLPALITEEMLTWQQSGVRDVIVQLLKTNPTVQPAAH